MTINEAQDEIIEEFELLEDWTERYQLIVDMPQSSRKIHCPKRTRRMLTR